MRVVVSISNSTGNRKYEKRFDRIHDGRVRFLINIFGIDKCFPTFVIEILTDLPVK